MMVIDLGSMAALKSSLDSAVAILKAMVGIRDAAMIQSKVIELQGVILSAQSSALTANIAQFALLDRVRDLEQEIVQLKDWEREKQRYELKAIDGRAFAYMPKPGMADSEPPHWLCANCFNRRQKAFLQFKGQDTSPTGSRGDQSTYGCGTCNASLKVYLHERPFEAVGRFFCPTVLRVSCSAALALPPCGFGGVASARRSASSRRRSVSVS